MKYDYTAIANTTTQIYMIKNCFFMGGVPSFVQLLDNNGHKCVYKGI